jgi:hypothetical protein
MTKKSSKSRGKKKPRSVNFKSSQDLSEWLSALDSPSSSNGTSPEKQRMENEKMRTPGNAGTEGQNECLPKGAEAVIADNSDKDESLRCNE